MYIYTNPHNHNIHQISPIHKFIKSHIQLCHNSSTIKFQMSQVSIHQTHLSSTITIHMQQQDNISICNAPILDTYMHVVPNLLKVVTHDATKTSYVRVHLLLQFTYVKSISFTFQHMTQYDYDAWTYK
jgi:hypothetical protein